MASYGLWGMSRVRPSRSGRATYFLVPTTPLPCGCQASVATRIFMPCLALSRLSRNPGIARVQRSLLWIPAFAGTSGVFYRFAPCLRGLRVRGDGLGVTAIVCPRNDLKATVVAFGDCRAAFDPVAAVDVPKTVIVVHSGGVDVAADHALGLTVLGLRRPRPLES